MLTNASSSVHILSEIVKFRGSKAANNPMNSFCLERGRINFNTLGALWLSNSAPWKFYRTTFIIFCFWSREIVMSKWYPIPNLLLIKSHEPRMSSFPWVMIATLWAKFSAYSR